MSTLLQILSRIVLAALLFLGGARLGAAEKKLNVLFLVADDLRPELGCYGASHIHSPHIDQLAARGLVFDRAYCQQAVCNPSRCSVLSGCRPDTTHCMANNTFLRPSMPDVLTLPQHFKNNGWYALSLGKVFHHSEAEPGDDPQSWSEQSWYHATPYRSWFTKESDDMMKRLKALPPGERPKLVRGPPYEASNEPDDVYPDGQTALKAIETLRRLKQMDKPFFLGVGFVKPHLPFTCPQKYWDLYPKESIKLPDNYFPPKNVPEPALHNWYELRTYGGIPATGGIPDETALNMIRGYRACISFMDAQMGRVLDELDRLGLRDNTIVIFWGDNGYHLGENGIFTKMTNFELGTHVPLLISVPGQKTAGQHSHALVEFVDMYPSLAELAGLPRPEHLEGTSFVPLLEHPDQPWKQAVFSQYLRPGKDKFMGRSVRTDRWRYTEWVNGKNESAGVELYDEKNDPKENVNVADDTTYKSEIDELAKTLHAGWRAAVHGSAKPVSAAAPTPAAPAAPTAVVSGDGVIGSFEGKTWESWQVAGDAFGNAPFKPGDSGRCTGFEGSGVAWSGRGGVSIKGTLLSPVFQIQHPFLNYLIGGARDVPSVLGAELLVDGKVVRAGSASEARDPEKALYWRTWDLRSFQGRNAQIRVNDQSAAGALFVDQFVQSDQAKGVPADASVLGQESHRPQFHYTALTGWLNDANGLLHYKDQWHLFHQHRPPGAGIGWGHAVSNDLVHWTRLPDAIALGNSDAAASGSGLVDWENASGLKQGEDAPVLLFHTLMPPANGDRKATQCLVYSTDGLQTFQTFSDNPLLRTEATRDRDPKVFFHKPTRSWIMALSLSRNNADREHATYGLFRSKDLKSWELLQELGPGAWYWECPDMFEMPLDGDAAKTKWVFMKGSGDYIVGSFDGSRFTPEVGPIRVHWGGSFYGAQTFSDAPHGRRVQMAWMSTAKNGPNSYPGMPFNQQMSFPHELTLRSTPEGPRIFRQPVAEIAKLRTATHDLGARTLAPGENVLAGMAPGLLELELELDLQHAQSLSLRCRTAELSYDMKSKHLRCLGAAPLLELHEGRLSLHVLIDRTSVEAFANDGALDVGGIYFSDMSDDRLFLTVDGGPAQIRRLIVHELKSIWEDAASH